MARGRPRKTDSASRSPKPKENGANLGFEAQLFLAADKLRKNLEPSDYKHVALGLIFLKHISNAFEARRAALLHAPEPLALKCQTFARSTTFQERWRCKRCPELAGSFQTIRRPSANVRSLRTADGWSR